MYEETPSTQLARTSGFRSADSFGGWMSKLRPISNTPLSKPKPKDPSSTDSRLGGRLQLERLRHTWTQESPKPLSRLRTGPPRSHRRLIVDIENKPGTYGPGDYTHPKITAIGWKWIGEESPRRRSGAEGRVLRRDDRDGMRAIAEELRGEWDQADFIVGHNARRHDVKILDGWFTTLDLPLPERRRVIDTYLDMPRMKGLSRSLENLTARWGCPIPKPHLEEHVWEAAYDGVPWAVDRMQRRVMADVAINEWLYYELLERNLLRW